MNGGTQKTYRLIVAYDGTDLAGWQRQKNTVDTVQQQLEEALGHILSTPVRTTASGRTDAGVHALGQAVHVVLPDSEAVRGSEESVLRSLVSGPNAYLPPQIRVMRADRMPEGFHARKNARSKTYRYRWVMGFVTLPQQSRYVARVEPGLDLAAMRLAARHFEGRHDFSAFAKSGGAHDQPVRTVSRAHLTSCGARLDFEIEGEGFLRGMVRAMAGTLLEVGRHQRAASAVPELLGDEHRPAASRSAAGPNAPARGLTLVEVRYDPPWLPLSPGFPPTVDAE